MKNMTDAQTLNANTVEAVLSRNEGVITAARDRRELAAFEIEALRSSGVCRPTGTVVVPSLESRLGDPILSSDGTPSTCRPARYFFCGVQVEPNQCHRNVQKIVEAVDKFVAVFGVAEHANETIVHSWLEDTETGEWIDPTAAVNNPFADGSYVYDGSGSLYYVGIPSPLVYGDGHDIVEFFVVQSFSDYCEECGEAAGVIVITNDTHGPQDQSALRVIAGDCILFEVVSGHRGNLPVSAERLNCTLFNSLEEYVESLGWSMTRPTDELESITLQHNLPCDVAGCAPFDADDFSQRCDD